ncbi:nucleotide-binding universal stress UspA family protein [Arthrobacter sp. SLBN-100]|uniref:universal stress protein n=1 Tax=Arthrobacter sp. SLBN-100 TaxID=2768450 RepID=UPI00114EC97F|nr:universal stress protein [Arthrobacter sp. SLBN-100]TQJ66382.1 nucleotide-binding universal stress UspA family protein [Arthrobacter sp. SLBN-100]
MSESSGVSAIVVGVDGSEQSILALRWAGALAPLFQASIRAVTCWQFQIAVGTFTPLVWDPEKDAREICAAAVSKAFGDSTPVDIQMVISQGPPAKVLVEESRRARLVVVGSRGHGGFEGLLLGSVSAAVAEHAKCPVLIAHGSDLPPAFPDAVATALTVGGNHPSPARAGS